MNRRNFLRMMVGGVAAGAAVRTFPFRVYSFPKQINLEPLPLPLSLYGMRYADVYAETGTMYGITRYGVFESGGAPGGWKKISQEIDIVEAKRIFRGPFHWQDHAEVRYSVLQPDGSVVDD